MRDQKLKKEEEHIITQYKAGNLNPGLGNKHLKGTSFDYTRTRSGIRCFFYREEKKYTIDIYLVAVSTKALEPRMINALKKNKNSIMKKIKKY